MSLLESVKILIAEKPDLSQLVAQLKDDSISLEERWEAFTLLVDNHLLVNESNYYGDSEIGQLESVGGSQYTLYDDFGADRYVSMPFTEMYGTMLEKIKWKDDMAPTPESLRNWKERVLQNGYSHVVNDW